MRKLWLLLPVFATLLVSCEEHTELEGCRVSDETQSDGMFTIEVDNEGFKGVKTFCKKIRVFDIPVIAAGNVNNSKLYHAAHVMAEYLDNDLDGFVDDELVVEQMKNNGAFLVMWAEESQLDKLFETGDAQLEMGQDLGADEANPYFYPQLEGEFDAALEEVLHLITSKGYAYAYPEIFGEDTTSAISRLMDEARGGHFQEVPDEYPDWAWYTYDDETCDYSCQITEFTYWSITSIMGLQTYPGRYEEIQDEWDTWEMYNNTSFYEFFDEYEDLIPFYPPTGSYRPQ